MWTRLFSRLEESKKITLDTLEKQRLQYTDAFRRSSDIIQRAEEGIKIMKNNMENYRNYQTKGLINKDQLTNQVALYYQQQNNLLSLSGQNEQNALQITTLESQIQTQQQILITVSTRWNCNGTSYRKNWLTLMWRAKSLSGR